MLPLPLLLLLLQLLLPTPAVCESATGAPSHFCDGEEFRSILSDVYLPSCLAEGGKASEGDQSCSLMHHFEHLAEREGRSLDDIMSRVTVIVFAHSDFTNQLVDPKYPSLSTELELRHHNAFIGVTKCLKAANSTCQRLRLACLGGYANEFVFILSGHCSKSFGCSNIPANKLDQQIMLLNMPQYIQFRLIERQVFIAKELGELQFSTSINSEYLIQTELNDTYGRQLISSRSKPLAMFVAGPKKTLAYYQQLVWFLDMALSHKDVFAFHLVATSLSNIGSQSERPLFRWKVESHESYLALYSKELCSSNPTWVFSCKPLIATGNKLLFAEQYSSFLMHGMLTPNSAVVRAPTEELTTFLHLSTSYVLAVMPADEMLSDVHINKEMTKTLVPYLESSFGITYHPLVVTKATAVQALKDLNTGLDLEQAFYRPCFFIRFPNGAHAVLKIEEPIIVLDKTVRQTAREGNYEVILSSAREMFNNDYLTELPNSITEAGHLIRFVNNVENEMLEILEMNRVKNRTDAFVEQLKFNDIYDVTDVLVVESDPKLMQQFFEKLGHDKPWLVLFTVSWSPLCKAARSVWSAVGQCARRLGFPDVQLVKVDCFEANEICQTLRVTSYPTVSMFSRGIQLNIYSGPIVSADLCLYVKLSFEAPLLKSESKEDTKQLLLKIMSIKSRAFVLQGAEVPSRLAVLAKSLRFREVFVHEKATGQPKLRAVYSDVRPSASHYSGSLDDDNGLLDFVENGHLGSVFPCTWTYLPQALKRDHPLVMLFHLDTKDTNDAASLLEGIHNRFSDRAAFCLLNLRNFTHLNDLVNRIAGLSLPALVTLTQPPGASSKVTHRLALGAVPASELQTRTDEWLTQALNHQLKDGRSVESDEKWQPASQVFNFVDQVYHGKELPRDDHLAMASSRIFSMESNADGQMKYRGENGAGIEDLEKTSPSKLVDTPIMMSSSRPGRSEMRDEL